MSEFPKREVHTHNWRIYNEKTGEIVHEFRTKGAAEHVQWCRATRDRTPVALSPWKVARVPIVSMHSNNHPLLGDVS